MPAKLDPSQRGCTYCPLNEITGLNKVINLAAIKGKRIMVWAQAPGKEENYAGEELIGPSGKMFWQEFAAYGVTREMCDVQNVVRCRPTQIINGFYGRKVVDRAPDKEEIHACSIYTEKALKLQRGRAKVHVVLGRVAAKGLLKGEYRKDKSSFFSKRLNAHVFCVYHPSYFLRGGTSGKLKEFRAGLRAAAAAAIGSRNRFAYVQGMDYRWVPPKGLAQFLRDVRAAAKAGYRITVDIEKAELPNKKEIMICVGFSWKPGISRIVLLAHEKIHWPRKTRRYILKFLKLFFEDEKIEKSFHHGSSDCLEVAKLLGFQIRGYTWDTEYSEYATFPGRRRYGLASIADVRFPEMAGYKDILEPYWTERKYAEGEAPKKGRKRVKLYPNLYTVPLHILRVYNGADADLSKRIEITTNKTTPLPLMRVFINAGFVIDRMEKNGPLFDFDHCKSVEAWLPSKIAAIKERIQVIAANPKFECKTAAFYSLLYKKLRLQKHIPPEWLRENKKKLSTDKETLELLAPHHPLPKLIIDYRSYCKTQSTWVEGFQNSARMHSGRVRTLWWLTGTVTSRLRSGGKKTLDGMDAHGIVNLQNIVGDPTIENLMISDLNWRLVLEFLKNPNDAELLEKILDLDVFLGYDCSQLEIRVLAQLSQDPLLLKYLREDTDIHSAVGFELTSIPIDLIRKDRAIRTAMKALHFGVIYGLTPDSLFESMRASFAELDMKFEINGEKVTPERVADLHAGYFEKFSGAAAYLDGQVKSVEDLGHVKGLFGMNRDISMTGDMDRSTFWKNQARNTGIQQAAHQLILIALSAYRENPKRYALLRRINMEIHDSLFWTVKLRHLQLASKLAKYLMTTEVLKYMKREWPHIHWNVPLKVEGKAGFRLGVLPEYSTEEPGVFINEWLKKNAKVEAKTLEDAKKVA